MKHTRRTLALCGASLLCLVVAGSTEIGNSCWKRWLAGFGGLSDDLHSAFAPASGPQVATGKPADGAQKTGETTDNLDAEPIPETADAARDAPQTPATLAASDIRLRALGVQPEDVLPVIAAYKSDHVDLADALAHRSDNPAVRAALAWVALRAAPQRVDLARLQAFAAEYPDWPAAKWLREQMEARLMRLNDPIAVERFFTQDAPTTALGKLALARALKATGRIADGSRLARAIFRENDLTPYSEGLLRAEFGTVLTKGDYKYRVDRLLYKERLGAALHYAALAGPDVLALARARAAVISEAASDKAIAAVPESLRKDPGLLLAQVQKLRRADKLTEAAKLLEAAPRDGAQLIDPDAWWTERRMLARKLLDAGQPAVAYAVCAAVTAGSPETRVDASFHAGWIALRFLNDPTKAAAHFAVAAQLAESPTSRAKIAYWQGRTAEASTDPTVLASAHAYYVRAAAEGETYYGQLARGLVDTPVAPVRDPAQSATGDARTMAIRALEILYAAGEREAANALATASANSLRDRAQIGALAAVVAKEQDAHLALIVGKLLARRGQPVDSLAFPTFGIPTYEAVQNSAAPTVVYSVARQESAFMPAVVSRAGAKGLMQMIDSTAKRTAEKAGLPFDANRLVNDPSFNAKLGAAHLGELMAEQGGSLMLTFAAYNAGGGRVKQWIETYGDPRKPGVDPVDWVERIPFTETRNYVQHVMENVGMYEAVFAQQAKMEASRASREAKL